MNTALSTISKLPYGIEYVENTERLEGIFYKLDFFTAVIGNVSMRQVLQWLQLENSVSDFLEGFHVTDCYMGKDFVYQYCSIRLEVKDIYLWKESFDESMFDVVVPQLRLSISGMGLDYLRSIGIEPETFFRSVPNFGPESAFNITRVDHAFDFVNYRPDFLDKLQDYCKRNVTPAGRIATYKKTSGLVFQSREGVEQTVYIGAPKSTRLLRIYNKRKQLFDHSIGCYKVPNPYNNPDSWIRIEWQLRRGVAQDSLFNNEVDSAEKILRNIYDYYAFADVENTTPHTRRISSVWLDLFNWKEIPLKIIQNANFV